jgi:hypothetical protein
MRTFEVRVKLVPFNVEPSNVTDPRIILNLCYGNILQNLKQQLGDYMKCNFSIRLNCNNSKKHM